MFVCRPANAVTRLVPSSGRYVCFYNRAELLLIAFTLKSCLLPTILYPHSSNPALQVVCDEHGVDPTGTVSTFYIINLKALSIDARERCQAYAW